MNSDSFGRHFPIRRRPTPIPVAPPRVPTPMPPPNNNNCPGSNSKEQDQQITKNHHHPSSVGVELISKPSYKQQAQTLDNDVKTAWINPRIISKINTESIRRTDYNIPPSTERNFNGHYHSHAYQHHYQQPSYQKQQSCGRQHDRERMQPEREWEAPVNGRAKQRSQVPVPASTSVVAEARRKNRPVTGKLTRFQMEPPPPMHDPRGSLNRPSNAGRTKSKIPSTSHYQRVQRTVNPVTQQDRVKGFVGYHHQSATACYVSGMAGNSLHDSDSVYGVYAETKYIYAVNSLAGNLAESSAAAAFFARAAQKLNLSASPHRRKRYSSEESECSGFCTALQRFPPPVPPALLRRIGVKEVTGVGKVKVMLRVSNSTASSSGAPGAESESSNSFFSLDKRKKQVTLIDPSVCNGSAAPEDRRVGVAAPKMFAFDAIFSQDDSQTEVCSSALTDVIHAVINGTDGCLFCFGHAGLGKSYTMIGTPENSSTLGIIPCAISWLFKGINEQKQKTGARFSVRVSAVEICGPTNQLRDLLSGYANDSEQSPGVYLRDDPLFGNQPPHCELRVPTAEKAAHYLDAAVEGRQPTKEDTARDSHLLFTLHVYQYSVAGKGGVAGGRSRLHLIDLGNSERGKASGGIPLSGLGNILLAIFNGQKHLPYKEHKLTHLLKDCLSSLTCHAAMIAHVSPFAQNYTDTLTAVQLASRIHRMRRRKFKFASTAAGNGSGGSSGEEAARTTGSSEPDPSSSDLSADTVIYVGPMDDQTDCEHPPVHIPSLNSGDIRCTIGKDIKGSNVERILVSKNQKPEEKPSFHRPSTKTSQSNKTSPAHTSSPKASPSRIPSMKNKTENSKHLANGCSDEQWIDGPRISKSKVAEARHLIKEAGHVKKRETWVDGPMQAEACIGYGYMDNHKKNMIRKWVEHQTIQIQKSRHVHPKSSGDAKYSKEQPKELTQFKCSAEEGIVKPINTRKHDLVEESVIRTGLKMATMVSDAIFECQTPDEIEDNHLLEEDVEDDEAPEIPPALPLIRPLSSKEVSLESLDQLLKERMISNAEYNSNQNSFYQDRAESEGEDILEIIEVEEPLEPVPTQDCCLQVTEEDIALCMGYSENPLPEVDQENPLDHPLRILSQENLTVVSTFTDSMSVFTDLERILPRQYFDRYGVLNDDYEDPDNPYLKNGNFDDTTKRKFDQLARLHELYSNRLAKANVANSETYQKQKQNNRVLTRCESLSLTDMLYGGGEHAHDNSSVYSEPAYVQEKFCENCKVNKIRPATAQNWYSDMHYSASIQDLRETKPMESAISSRFQRYSHKYKDNTLAYLRHPDGASNPNLREETTKRLPGNGATSVENNLDGMKSITSQPLPPPNSLPSVERVNRAVLNLETGVTALKLTQKSEGYDSGHDSTPRTSKHSPAAISRRAESGYDSVVRDSESSSIDSEPSRSHFHNRRGKCKHKHDKSFCSWFLNPFTCKYVNEAPETHF